jgi:hypothetical protein
MHCLEAVFRVWVAARRRGATAVHARAVLISALLQEIDHEEPWSSHTWALNRRKCMEHKSCSEIAVQHWASGVLQTPLGAAERNERSFVAGIAPCAAE